MIRKNLTGQRINHFTVLGDSGKRHNNGNVLWLVKCVCGGEKLLTPDRIRINKSCGCLRHILQSRNRNIWKGYKDISGTFWSHIKKNAKKRKLHMDISVEYAWDIFVKQNKQCALTGVAIYFPSKVNLCDGTASLDRINSDKGYVVNNVQWLHKDMNFMKQQYSTEKFINWCTKVYKYQNFLKKQ
jgi:hypothetical protein